MGPKRGAKLLLLLLNRCFKYVSSIHGSGHGLENGSDFGPAAAVPPESISTDIASPPGVIPY